MIEFDCAHCDVHVVGFGRDTVPERPLCLSCGFIAASPPDIDRSDLARQLLDPEALEVWQSRANPRGHPEAPHAAADAGP